MSAGFHVDVPEWDEWHRNLCLRIGEHMEDAGISQRRAVGMVGSIDRKDISKICKTSTEVGLKRAVRVGLSMGLPIQLTIGGVPLLDTHKSRKVRRPKRPLRAA